MAALQLAPTERDYIDFARLQREVRPALPPLTTPLTTHPHYPPSLHSPLHPLPTHPYHTALYTPCPHPLPTPLTAPLGKPMTTPPLAPPPYHLPGGSMCGCRP